MKNGKQLEYSQTVADQNGVTVEEVKREIQAIIDDLYDSDDPAIKAK